MKRLPGNLELILHSNAIELNVKVIGTFATFNPQIDET